MTSKGWQLTGTAAEGYQDIIVPWILGPFAEALVEVAAPRVGEVVLDVGCGTGAATRAAAALVGPSGRVVGLDINAGMLAVARATAGGEGITWVEGSATELPLEDQSFDVVVSAQAIQFVPDTAAAAREIQRVGRAGGRVAVSVWRGVDRNPYFAATGAAVAEHLGAEAGRGLTAGFRMTDPGDLMAAFHAAGLEDVLLGTIARELDLPDLMTLVPRHMAATPVAPALHAAAPGTGEAIGASAAAALAPFAIGDGARIPFESWCVQARIPGG